MIARPMERYPDYTRGRLTQTLDRLRALVHPDRLALDELLVSPAVGRISRAEAQALEYRPAAIGDRFGPVWATFWFRVGATVPAEWAGSRVDLLWMTNRESTLWLGDRPAQGLFDYDGYERAYDRPSAPLLAEARGGERLQAELELACNVLAAPGSPEVPAMLARAEIARFDEQAWRLLQDFRVLVLLEAEHAKGLDPSWAGELLSELNRFCNVWDADDRDTWTDAAEILVPLLERRNGGRVHELFAIGHGHLDTAWVWPLAETYRKCQRTFSTQLVLMRDYPEFRFACSSAQHYAWVKERDPQLYDEIRARVGEERWVPVGGSWIEPDCNLPWGESLARQFLYGQRFFEQEFGRRCTEHWNPDAFGYTNQLPQLLRGAGMTRFLSQKLEWNRFTKSPFHTFAWEGLDGSRVTTHIPPIDMAEPHVSPAELRKGEADYRDHDFSRHSLLLFGHGDGGGGPTPEMLETLRRVSDLQGVPRTTIATSERFFDALEQDAPELPVVVGELYFEYHRGTYTSQAAIKRAHRRGEGLLHDAEFLAAAASRLGRRPYPAAELQSLWRVLLLNEFHDILPGASIREVNAEAIGQLDQLERDARVLCADAAAALAGEAEPAAQLPVNTIGAPRAEVSELPGGELAFAVAPAYGIGRQAEPSDSVRVDEDADGFVLANEVLTARLARDGSLVSLALKADGREALAEPGNRLELYEDRPLRFDAWDIDPFALETRRPCAGAHDARVARADPLRAEIVFEHEIGKDSRAVQTVRLDAGAQRLEFHTEVEWHERNRLLKVAFPLAVRAERATYETPFGHTERPTHYSTTADLARFEVCGHRWADLSEHGYGVALLNDCKYGHSAHHNVLRLSLLRAATSPDPEADQGLHRFAYALFPHAGGWREAGVVAEARRFNAPLLWAAGQAEPRSLASVDHPNLVLDTIKQAEDGEQLVLRLYEAYGARGVARVRLDVPFQRAHFANLLEDPGETADLEDGAIVVPYQPHQIITLIVD